MTTKIDHPRLLSPGQDYGAPDEPVEAKAWKNIVFMRSGATHLTDPVHQSEIAAKLVADEALKNLKELIGDDIHRMIEFHDGFWDRASNIVLTMQIPWNQ